MAVQGFSDAVERKILDHLFDDGTYTVTGPVYLALTTVAVAEGDTAATITEATYTGYARKAIANTDMNAASTTSNNTTKVNGNALSFPGCTAGTSTCIGFAICSTSSGAGDVIMFGTLPSVVISTTQTPATVGAGALSAALD